jgi:hypothetical protein
LTVKETVFISMRDLLTTDILSTAQSRTMQTNNLLIPGLIPAPIAAIFSASVQPFNPPLNFYSQL